jgi:hypothetical protein
MKHVNRVELIQRMDQKVPIHFPNQRIDQDPKFRTNPKAKN